MCLRTCLGQYVAKVTVKHIKNNDDDDLGFRAPQQSIENNPGQNKTYELIHSLIKLSLSVNRLTES